jgi:hypothetical protein
MSNLIERYVGAATRHLPENSRNDAARDIRVMVDELVDARVAAGEDPVTATTAVLNELGDPAHVARSFEDRPRYLVGPQYYRHYIWLIRTLLSWVPGVVFVVLMTINVLTDDQPLVQSFVGGILDAGGTAFIVAVQIAFWVTLVYAIMEWANPSGAEPERKGEWSVADLPEEAPRRQVSAIDAAWGVGVMVFTGTLLVVQHVRGVKAFIRGDEITDALDGRVVPFFNPDIPSWMVTAVFALIAFTAVSEIVKFAIGNWTLPATIAEVIASLLWIALPAIVIGQWSLVNPEINRVWDSQAAEWLTGSDFERLVLVGLVLVSAWSIVEAIRGYLAYRKRAPEDATPHEDFVFIV